MQSRRIKISLEDVSDIMAEKLKDGGEIIYSPKGLSMLPLIKEERDTVTLKKIDELKKYDIVFFKRKDGSFVLHRIIKNQKDGKYIICGDNQCVLEKDVDKDMIIAKVFALKRGKKDVNLNGAAYKIYVRLLFLRRFQLKYLRVYVFKAVLKKFIRFLGFGKDGK